MKFSATATKPMRKTVLLAGTLAALALPAMADPMLSADQSMQQNQPMQPLQPVTQGNVTYLSGGIGDDEKAELQAEAHHYNLYILNSNRAGAYASDTSLIITGRDGRPVLNADDTGPLFYANLPAGKYRIEAMNGEQKITRNLTIAARHQTRLSFVWSQPSDD